MARKVTKIIIDNYRAWYGPYEPIHLPNGENLLIYGENGSGKSSFFKALQNFFRSALNQEPAFELNVFSVQNSNTNGSVTLEFTDMTTNTVNGYVYTLGGASTNQQVFINDTRKLNSFFDYKHMLGVHYTDPESLTTPDLFYALIEVLLGDYQLPAIGRTILQEIKSIELGLQRRSDSRQYKEAENSLATVQGAIVQVRDDVLLETNRLLHYFDNGLQVQLIDFVFEINSNYRKWLNKVFKLQVVYGGQVFSNYNQFLNEARLSSIAICFYLAAIRTHPPAAADYKIVYLDDVFIGLDTSNRIPLLELLNTEFAGFQIFMNTYDRFWYEVAKDWFSRHMPNQWKFQEMYVSKREHIQGRPAFDITVSTEGGSNFSKAMYYLNNTYKPDYPAAANYLRKYAEEIFKKYIPEVELKKNDEESIGEFPEFIMLSDLMKCVKAFLKKINQDVSLLTLLKDHSKRLLNPLSHYNPSTPIYKNELDNIIDLLPQIEAYLSNLRRSVFNEALSPHSLMRMRFAIASNDLGYYELRVNEQLYKYRDLVTGGVTFSNPKCKTIVSYRITNTVKTTDTRVAAVYDSLTEAYNSIYSYQVENQFPALPLEDYWVDAFEFKDTVGNWTPLNTLAVWP